MTNRYICIHGHFYQPPRDNPWLEAIEIQDSAQPYHDWNERITAECYAPNVASRVLDGERRILDIVSNYVKISFNFGPTVLSWMETAVPETYHAIIDADRLSAELRSGHGNAIAQAYNHLIMPLATGRDKRTQVIWGIRDFEHRFKRFPEGMWIPETAVDMDTLNIMAEQGIKFTILAPHQAKRVRRISSDLAESPVDGEIAGQWEDVIGGRVDPTRPYLCRLPMGGTMTIFFYDGPISRAVAFERLLNRGEDFASRLVGGFSEDRTWPQLVHIATDGESYGHHHRFGEMALTAALLHIESRGLAKVTNYGEYLEHHPPTHEVEIIENSSWSCVHGIERWKKNCGCNTGGHPGWNQEWRAPLRKAQDWLRDELAAVYELTAREYLKDPWQARDDYISIILDRSSEGLVRFFSKHAAWVLTEDEKSTALKLLEMQRHALLMYTSCGWFFDELTGIETVQVIQYAARAIQLAQDLLQADWEKRFAERLADAKSNLPTHRDGSRLYESIIRPTVVDLPKVGAHYSVSSLFTDYPDSVGVYCYRVEREDLKKFEAGKTTLAIGRISVISEITRDRDDFSFSVLHLGGRDLNGGVSVYSGDEAYGAMKEEMISAFHQGQFADVIRMMDRHFGMNTFTLRHLFRDEQRKILHALLSTTLDEFENAYRSIYENNYSLMEYLRETGIPIPRAFRTAAEFVLNLDLKSAFRAERIDADVIRAVADNVRRWEVPLDATDLEYILRRRVEDLMNAVYHDPSNGGRLAEFRGVLENLQLMPIELNFWQTQNLYYRMAKAVYAGMLAKAEAGEEEASQWVKTFVETGQLLFFNVEAILPKNQDGNEVRSLLP